jgi:CBS domain-containing protein
MLPLLVCCMSAHTVAVLLMRRDILTEKVARHGHHVIREWHVDPFATTQVESVMAKTVEALPSTMTLHAAASFLTAPTTRHPRFPVIDDDRHVLGILNPPAVLAWRRAGRHRTTSIGELCSEQKPPPVAYPDEYLENVVERMNTANVAHLPVVSRDGQRLVGYIAWKDLLRVRSRIHEEMTLRAVFYPAHRA